jgi:integrase
MSPQELKPCCKRSLAKGVDYCSTCFADLPDETTLVRDGSFWPRMPKPVAPIPSGHKPINNTNRSWFFGIRPSEYLGLKWAHVDLEQGVINVQRSLHWRSYKTGDWYFGEPKTPRSRRRIPLPVSVSRALIEHRRHQGEERLKAGPEYKNLGLVFAKWKANH